MRRSLPFSASIYLLGYAALIDAKVPFSYRHIPLAHAALIDVHFHLGIHIPLEVLRLIDAALAI